MQLVVGSYERFLLGYTVPQPIPVDGLVLSRTFTHAAHQGPVRCLDSAGNFLVSGGQDDQLHIYDLKHGKDLGFLMNPGDGAITALQLFTPGGATRPSHMLSGSADGSVAIWRAGGEWEHLKLMKGHKGQVNSLAVHPSGRLALSVAHDKALRMWSLLKGRCTYTAPLEAEGDVVRFSPSGEAYTLVCGPRISVQQVAASEGGPQQLMLPRRALCLLQQHEQVLLSGLEDGSMVMWDLRTSSSSSSSQQQAQFPGHKTRIRALAVVTPDPGAALPTHFASASSDGVVKVWDARMLGSSSGSSSSQGPKQLAAVDSKARVTSMAVYDPSRRAPKLEAGGEQEEEALAGRAAPQEQQQQQQQLDSCGKPPQSRKPAQQHKKQRPSLQAEQHQQANEHELQSRPQQEQQQLLEQPEKKRKKQQQQQQQQHQAQHAKPAMQNGSPAGHPKKHKKAKPGGAETLVPLVKDTQLMKKRKQKIMQRSKGRHQ